MCNDESKSGPKDDRRAPIGDTKLKTSPKHDLFAQMCNPQDEPQMASEMGWGADNSLTAEEESQMAEDLGWSVVEDDTPM
eukprot:12255374-Karenia_brevis.AAC.1